MPRAAMLLTSVLAVMLAAQPITAATPREATEFALELVRDVRAYTVSNPHAPGAFAPWSGSEPEVVECVPFRSPDTGEPLAYRVVLNGPEATYVVIDADDGSWLAYGLTRDAEFVESERRNEPTDGNSRAGDRNPASWYIPGVPHYYQSWSNNCGPTGIEMAMDYWGPHVPQLEVTYAANNPADGVNAGATNSDMLRAIHFSAISTAAGDTTLQGYSVRSLGYATALIDWSEPAHFPDRYDDIKRIVSSGIPFLMKTRFAEGVGAWHMRVVRGYDDAMDVFIVHDPWYDLPFSGPDVHFNQAYLLDTLWPYGGPMMGFLAHPWEVSVCLPPEVAPGERFTIGAAATYAGPHPFDGHYGLTSADATLELPSDLAFAPGETPTKPLDRLSVTGTVSAASWEVVAGPSPASSEISVVARGLITASATSYGSYTDSLGAYGTATINTVSGAAPQTRILIDAGGTGDYETILEGIAAADPGDTVVVAAGDYSGPMNRDLDLLGKALTLTSDGGRSDVVIDCEGACPAFRFDSGETPSTVVQGLTIVNGASLGSFGGGIVFTAGSSPTIRDCVVQDCSAGFLGGGLYCEVGSSPVLESTVVAGCTSVAGSGLYCRDASNPTILNCTFHANTSNQLVANNAAPVVANTVISGSPTGGPLACVSGAIPTVTHCVVYGNASGDSLCGGYGDNLFADPLYCDSGAGDLTVHDDSPCLPNGNPWGEPVGALGAGGCGASTGIGSEDEVCGLALSPARPNPFLGATWMELSVPEPGARVDVAVYSVTGRRVRTLAEGYVPPGTSRLVWDGLDEAGRPAAAGVYFARCRDLAGGVRKLVLMK